FVAVAMERGVIQRGLAIDVDPCAAVRGAVDRAAGDRARELHAVTFFSFTGEGGIAAIGQRAGDIHTGAVSGIAAQGGVIKGMIA
ncbi:hypothetical protein, partial [Yersinia similis]|uniref:hypothetical protein n=1 Tax=Yersinia similis TaxID=367190 RepID=UPI001643DFFC